MSVIYSAGGISAGKIGYLLNCSVEFPNNNEDRSKKWGYAIKRKNSNIPRSINFGCRRSKISNDCINYNAENCYNKVECFKKFDEHCLPHPELIHINVPKGRFLGRAEKGSHGSGVVLYDNVELRATLNGKDMSVKGHDFFVKFIDAKSEHRVYTFFDKYIIEVDKTWPKDHEFIHSVRFGTEFKVRPLTAVKRDYIIAISQMAVAALDLEFGAVDVVVDKYDNPYILEVNSDPAFPDVIGYYAAQAFCDYFNIPWQNEEKILQDGRILDLKKEKIEEDKNE